MSSAVMNNPVKVQLLVKYGNHLPGSVVELVQRGRSLAFTWFTVKGHSPTAVGYQLFLGFHEFKLVKGTLQ